MIREYLRFCAFTGIVLLAFTSVCPGRFIIEVRRSERACFEQDVNNALNTISNATPELGAMIRDLVTSTNEHVIWLFNGKTISSWFPPHKIHTVNFNPWLHERFPTSGVCIDPVAALAHDLRHAYENQTGVLLKNRTNFVEGIAISELNAVKAENSYRQSKGLCPRTAYDPYFLPAAYMPSGICADPRSIPCVPPKTV